MTPPMISISALNEISAVRHGFFTREGGVSDGIYASLNCGLGSLDDPEKINANRRKIAKAFNLGPESLATLTQIHSSDVLTLGPDWRPSDIPPAADAMVTKTPGILLGLGSADCAPVLFVDPKARVIGAAHSGWKGAISGVLENTVAKMTALGADPTRILTAIGPCIAQRSYEVGQAFVETFLANDPENSAFFADDPQTGRPHFDLPGFIAKRLSALGLTMIARTPCDTMREENRFFSYRRATLRGETDYGRSLSVIMLER